MRRLKRRPAAAEIRETIVRWRGAAVSSPRVVRGRTYPASNMKDHLAVGRRDAAWVRRSTWTRP
jgi:hypothetical protein